MEGKPKIKTIGLLLNIRAITAVDELPDRKLLVHTHASPYTILYPSKDEFREFCRYLLKRGETFCSVLAEEEEKDELC